jgi:hypothetical protein
VLRILNICEECVRFNIVQESKFMFEFNYEGVSKSFRTESITKYTLTFGITH